MPNNLPGVNVLVKDGGLVAPETSTTETMLIIAESLAPNAPEEPVLVRTSNDLLTSGFGGFYVGGVLNPIAAEWLAASNAGNRSIYLVALKEATVSGVAGDDDASKKLRKFMFAHNLLTNTLADFAVDHIVIRGVTSSDQIEGLTDAMFADYMGDGSYPSIEGLLAAAYVAESNTITLPLTIGGSDSITIDGKTISLTANTYDGSATKTLVDLAADITAKMGTATPSALKGKVLAQNGKLVFYLEKTSAAFAATGAGLIAAVAGKTPVLKRTPEGIIGVGSFSKLLGDYCASQTLQHNACVGYIAAPSPANVTLADLRTHVASLVNTDIRISEYVNTIAFDVAITMPGTNAVHYMNGVTQYAAFVSTLPVQSGTTNKQLPGILGPRYELSPRQLSQLTEKGYVTLRRKDGVMKVVEGITSAPFIEVANIVRPSDFTKLSTLRTIQRAVQTVRTATDPFIGEANEMPQYNALKTAIKSALTKLVENRVISDFAFSVTATSGTLDEATVQLKIVPMFELRAVDVELSLTTAL
jgi:hypothetical protein